jgi:flagellar hook-length control protein FliK
VAVLSGSTSPSASVEIRGAVPLRAVLPAMVERISAALSGSFDLRLSPEELGSLKISFSTGETGLNVVIQTERPETLELFRRNIEQFTQDLKSLGYEDINLSFGNDGGRASEQAALLPQQGMSGGNDELPLAAATDGAGARETLRGGLDLRL